MCDMWQGKIIHVPKLKPTLLGCDLIRLDYTLTVSHVTSLVQNTWLTFLG